MMYSKLLIFNHRVDGAGTRSRTRDLLITSQLLYQLSYAGSGRPEGRLLLWCYALGVSPETGLAWLG